MNTVGTIPELLRQVADRMERHAAGGGEDRASSPYICDCLDYADDVATGDTIAGAHEWLRRLGMSNGFHVFHWAYAQGGVGYRQERRVTWLRVAAILYLGGRVPDGSEFAHFVTNSKDWT